MKQYKELPAGIEIDPRICFGEPRIAGHRIPTRDIGKSFWLGRSITDIGHEYPTINRLEIEAAIRFEAERRHYRKIIKRAKRECEAYWCGKGPSKLEGDDGEC